MVFVGTLHTLMSEGFKPEAVFSFCEQNFPEIKKIFLELQEHLQCVAVWMVNRTEIGVNSRLC